MLYTDTVDTSSLVLSFSNALDLAETSLVRHQQRVAYIAWRMCLSGKTESRLTRTVYMAALFHDIGAFSIKEKKALHNFEIDETIAHCKRGYLLLKDNFWLSKVALMVLNHHKRWKEWKEQKSGLIEDIVFGSQILCLADYVERLIDRNRCILHQHEYIIKEITSLSGDYFHSHIVDLFLENAKREEFWLNLATGDIGNILLNEGPMKGEEMRFSVLLPVSELFRNVIDFRSRFTSTHSAGVAAAASKLAECYGFSKKEIEMMQIAGNFHDAGKLAIPDRILEKPYGLNEKEAQMMKSHVFFTYKILNNVRGLEKIAQWAGFHHERLNGMGYPFHLTDEELDTGSKILMIADLFTALVEERPYKKGMDRRKVLSILGKMADKGEIDRNVLKVLKENYEEILIFVEQSREEVAEEYNKKFAG